MSRTLKGIFVLFLVLAALDVHAQPPAPTPAEEVVEEEKPRRPPLYRRIFGARTPVEEEQTPEATQEAAPREPRATPAPPDEEEEAVEEPRRRPLIQRIFGARDRAEDEEVAVEEASSPVPTATPARPRVRPASTPTPSPPPASTPRPTATPTPTPSPTPEETDTSSETADPIPEVDEVDEETPAATPAPTPTLEEMQSIYDDAREKAMDTEAVKAAKTEADASTTEAEHYKNTIVFYDALFSAIEESNPEISTYVTSMRSAATRRLDRRRDQMKEVFQESTEIAETLRKEAKAKEEAETSEESETSH